MFKVGILDANDDTRSLVRLWLEKDYEISDYRNSEELSTDLRTKNLHLLLIDLKVRTAGGAQVINAIKTMRGRPRPVIIALIASAFTSDRENALETGFDDFVLKPIDEVKLRKTIEKYLN